jgi:hypothetical protein
MAAFDAERERQARRDPIGRLPAPGAAGSKNITGRRIDKDLAKNNILHNDQRRADMYIFI